MTMLTTVQHFCRRQNLPVPNTVSGSTDTQVRQVMALLEEEGESLAKQGPWQALTIEATHTSLAAESQGAITSIATNGFDYIKNDTIWDRTDNLPIIGPISGVAWQGLKGSVSTGPRYQYRIRGGLLLINPVPVASHTWAFEYVSKNWILAVDGTTYKQYFTADTDTMLLPEELLRLGLRWRWKREKGLEYGEEREDYKKRIAADLGRDGGKKILHMDSESGRGPRPGISVPQGSWTVP